MSINTYSVMLLCLLSPLSFVSWADEAGTLAKQSIKTLVQNYQQGCRSSTWQSWGTSLCSPFIFVEPQSRKVIASQGDNMGYLRQEGRLFEGRLPEEVLIANTAKHWAGVHWSMLLLPLPEGRHQQLQLLTHEAWHRNHSQLMHNSDNSHLSQLDARYLILLEMRALALALEQAHHHGHNKQAKACMADALYFRQHRYQIYAEARGNEQKLELNEGLAEYVALSLNVNSETVQQLIAKLTNAEFEQTLERNFAYLTGPAYGLLLEKQDPLFKQLVMQQLQSNKFSFAQAAYNMLGLERLESSREDIDKIAAKYNGVALWQSQKDKEKQRLKQRQGYINSLVQGDILTLPILAKMQMSFDPDQVFSLKPFGTVYSRITISDEWGNISVNGSLLLSDDFSQLRVPLSPNMKDPFPGKELTGPGWKLKLNPGWILNKVDKLFRVEKVGSS